MEFRKPYKCYSDKHIQSFDRKSITLTKCGKTYNVYDSIQAEREDTEVYPTLEKYGCIDRMQVDNAGVYADLTNALDLRGLHDQEIELRNIFDSLPLEERRIFNHDFYDFKQNGLAYYEKKAQDELSQKQKIETSEIVDDKGGVNNVEK